MPKARPSTVDKQIGVRLRVLRQKTSVTQTALAKAVGVTFQQIQKYEIGVNRISASKLYEISNFFEAPITYFFNGLLRRTAPAKRR